MQAIHVRDVPEEVIEALKRRAEQHHRSLQGELRHILSLAAEEAALYAPLPRLTLNLSEAGVSEDAGWGREDIYDDDAR